MTWHNLAVVGEIDRVPAGKEKNEEPCWFGFDSYISLALKRFAGFH